MRYVKSSMIYHPPENSAYLAIPPPFPLLLLILGFWVDHVDRPASVQTTSSNNLRIEGLPLLYKCNFYFVSFVSL